MRHKGVRYISPRSNNTKWWHRGLLHDVLLQHDATTPDHGQIDARLVLASMFCSDTSPCVWDEGNWQPHTIPGRSRTTVTTDLDIDRVSKHSADMTTGGLGSLPVEVPEDSTIQTKFSRTRGGKRSKLNSCTTASPALPARCLRGWSRRTLGWWHCNMRVLGSMKQFPAMRVFSILIGK